MSMRGAAMTHTKTICTANNMHRRHSPSIEKWQLEHAKGYTSSTRTLRQHMLTHSTASALSEYSTIAVVLLSGSPAAEGTAGSAPGFPMQQTCCYIPWAAQCSEAAWSPR